jgi:hypothetical protein
MINKLQIAIIVLFALAIYKFIIHPLLFSPLASLPGPKLYALSKWRLAYEDLKGTRTREIWRLHQRYGPVVRLGPNEVSFNSLSALRTIYGAGSGFERTRFYDMFDVYGTKNLFTFHGVKEHGERKKLLAHAYSKSKMLGGKNAEMIEGKVQNYLSLIEKDSVVASEIFSSLHYFSIDAITNFLYGSFGGTSCLHDVSDRSLLDDIMDVSRRKLSFFAVHFPRATKWLYAQTGLTGKLASKVYPMQKPTTYTRIREHALQAFYAFKAASESEKGREDTILAKLWKHHESQKAGGLSDLDIASECADHLLAGIDTTADSLMFLIWALSRPQNGHIQRKLREEVGGIPDNAIVDGIPSAEMCDKLPYLDAVIKETLRLYAPLPASEPRSPPRDMMIDGHNAPAGTVMSMSPFNLHRNPEVYRDPLEWRPERWLESSEKELMEMKKWFWAFSSGGRMCIGLQ